MATATTELLTADDLLRLNSQGVKGELIRGVLCETVSVGEEHGHISGIFITFLNVHIRPQKLGRAGGTDVGVLIQRNPDMVREPDVYYVSAERLPLGVRVQGYLEVMPELVVEIVSPNDRQEAVNDKTTMWLAHGVVDGGGSLPGGAGRDGASPGDSRRNADWRRRAGRRRCSAGLHPAAERNF